MGRSEAGAFVLTCHALMHWVLEKSPCAGRANPSGTLQIVLTRQGIFLFIQVMGPRQWLFHEEGGKTRFRIKGLS